MKDMTFEWKFENKIIETEHHKSELLTYFSTAFELVSGGFPLCLLENLWQEELIANLLSSEDVL